MELVEIGEREVLAIVNDLESSLSSAIRPLDFPFE